MDKILNLVKGGLISLPIILRTSPSFSTKICAKIVFSSMLCLAIVFLAQLSRAEDCNPLQISLWPSVQLIPKENAICGARLNLLWGENTSVMGIDAGLVNVAESLKGIEIGGINWLSGHERKESWGIQIAGINYAGNSSFIGPQIGFLNAGSSKDSITGIQAAAANINLGEINGIQLGLLNGGKNVNGLQIGFLNVGENVNGLQISYLGLNGADSINGLQLGLMNSANDMHGIQIGFINGGDHGVVHGMQIGFGNVAKDVHGIQMGLINSCESLSGLQIGLFNVVTGRFPDKGLFFFPVINVGF